jgi:acyl-CoA synthetase (AMP-forming)/AMP-acid ligase II
VNIASLVTRAARFWGARPAVTDGSRARSFAEIEDRSSRLADAFTRAGLRPGDRVAFLIGNRLEWYDLVFGAFKAGLVTVGLDPRHAVAALAFQIEDAQARVLVCDPDLMHALAPLVPTCVERVVALGPGGDFDALVDAGSSSFHALDVPDDHPAEMKYTSGTEGEPKGVVHSHRARMMSTLAMLPHVGLREDDMVMIVASILRGSGALAHMCLATGATQVLRPRFDAAEFVELLPVFGVTASQVVPTMLYSILDELRASAKPAATLRTLIYAAAPIAPARLDQCLEALGPVLIQSYGSTETKGGLTFLDKDDHLPGDGRLYSCGRPSLLAELEVRDESGAPTAPGEVGELHVKGPSLFREYWKRPAQTAAAFTPDGWYRTGDIARIDDGGYVYLLDRKREMIVTGGINVFPSDVERALLGHPAVAEAAVFGAPDDHWGEKVTAVVRLRPGAAGVAGDDLRVWLRSRLAGHEVPKAFDFWDEELPKNASGKIQRRDIRDRYWPGAGRRVS